MSSRGTAELTRTSAFSRGMGDLAGLVVYFGPSTRGLSGSVRFQRAFTARRRVRLALQSAETTRRRKARRRELIKGAVAMAALGALAFAFEQRRSGQPTSPGSKRSRPEAPGARSRSSLP